ncbi:MAG: citramalate synthase [Firmicutes bacterium]|nr:citramalate synthase [Bacillota bacterium]
MHHSHSEAHVTFDNVELPQSVEIYDTTLRDGSQQEGISLSVEDKINVARQIDALGVAYIEGGWPGSNPKDAEFFRRYAVGDFKLSHATLVAFGSTRRHGIKAFDDPTLLHLVKAGVPAACIVAKASSLHVTETLRTDLDEALAMVRDSVEFLVGEGLKVFLDAEHFFDGMLLKDDFSLRVLEAAEKSGAEALVLCDTNGGMLPESAEEIVTKVRRYTSATIGAHFHNDSGCAVANSLAAVRAGARQVQGCINGYGERAGNADLCATIPNLSLKMGVETIERERITLLTSVARHVSEIVNISLDPQKPYVGTAVFANKAGIHTSAIARRPDAYEHINPALVGNNSRVVLSELSGKSTVVMKAKELSLEIDDAAITKVLGLLKELEYQGYHFEVADGSLELLMRAAAGYDDVLFSIESFTVVNSWTRKEDNTSLQIGTIEDGAGTDGNRITVHPWQQDGILTTEASVNLKIGSKDIKATSTGNGPVNALDKALRKALIPHFPQLSDIALTDYRVRVVDTGHGTGAVTRVLIDSADADGSWSTIGVSDNIIEASWEALVDALVYGLRK